MIKQFGFIGNFLLFLVNRYKKTLPELDSKNSKRLQFILMFAALILYAWSRKIFVIPTDFYRTPMQQNRRFKKGNSQCDGYSKISDHQRWKASDILNLNFSLKPIWTVRVNYKTLAEFWKKMGGYWGGDWAYLDGGDIYHFGLK